MRICVEYMNFLKNQSFSGIYNGFENKSIIDIANQVSKKWLTIRVFKDKNDPRSYRLDSSKLINAGFKPKNFIDAIIEIINMHKDKKLKIDKKIFL